MGQVDQADVLDIVGNIVNSEVDQAVVLGGEFGHLRAKRNGKENETMVSVLVRDRDTDAPWGKIAVGMRRQRTEVEFWR